MFGAIVSGRLVQTGKCKSHWIVLKTLSNFRIISDFQQVDESKFLINIADADNLNYLVIFLTGATPLPLGIAGGKLRRNFLPFWCFRIPFQVFTSRGPTRITLLNGSTSDTSPTPNLRLSSRSPSSKNFTKWRNLQCLECSVQVKFLTSPRSEFPSSQNHRLCNKPPQQSAMPTRIMFSESVSWRTLLTSLPATPSVKARWRRIQTKPTCHCQLLWIGSPTSSGGLNKIPISGSNHANLRNKEWIEKTSLFWGGIFQVTWLTHIPQRRLKIHENK